MLNKAQSESEQAEIMTFRQAVSSMPEEDRRLTLYFLELLSGKIQKEQDVYASREDKGMDIRLAANRSKLTAEAGSSTAQAGGSSPFDAHPLLKELGGMGPRKFAEWMDNLTSNDPDQAAKELSNRLELAPTYKNKQQLTAKLTQTLKPVLDLAPTLRKRPTLAEELKSSMRPF